MSWVAKDLPTLIFQLLPGFLAAGVFYTLTAHPKASEFERVVQALIFTFIIKFLSLNTKGVLLGLGRIVAFGFWTADAELIWSLLFAPSVGLLFAYLANSDQAHRYLRHQRITTRTSYPSEWYSAFIREKRWVTLHLADQRRIFGWPEEWPDQPDRGHFVLYEAEWLLDNSERAPLYQVEWILIPASEVRMVEFHKESDEVPQDQIELQRVQDLLTKLREEKPEDGSQSADSGPESS